ncbi:hypothetical protein C8Q79DRAFT_266658 [Trametes meyenii]|nr:hypothetical protein C8Q79DRAFT_266658 [Trametes meyenii]
MRDLQLPSRPRRLRVIVGNSMSDFPNVRPWVELQDMRDLVYLQVLGQPTLVIGNADLAAEFLDKEPAKTSYRMSSSVVELSGQAFDFAFMPYSQWWRDHCRIFWQQFFPFVTARCRPIQEVKTRTFLTKLLESPSQVQNHIRNLFSTIMLKVVVVRR